MANSSARPNRRRAAVVALTAAMSASASAAAFTAVDVAAPTFASRAVRPRAVPSPTTLFAEGGSPEEKPSIETITDANRHALLRPPSSPSRPVLVDAMAPWCGPCKLLDKVLRKAMPRYAGRVDFVRWNVNDKENTVEIKNLFLGSGFTLTKLPSLIVFKDGTPVAVRAGMANEFQLDAFLEDSLPELERTFDNNGLKMVPLPLPEDSMATEEATKKKSAVAVDREVATHAKNVEDEILRQMSNLSFGAEEATSDTLAVEREIERVIQDEAVEIEEGDCIDPVECWERVEQNSWENRTVVPAMDGILLPARSYGSP